MRSHRDGGNEPGIAFCHNIIVGTWLAMSDPGITLRVLPRIVYSATIGRCQEQLRVTGVLIGVSI